MNIGELNELYQEAESCDSELFSEQRSNILLVAGHHYARRGSRFFNTLRRNDNLTQQQKIRLTKNHIQKISKTYVNNLISMAPGVAIGPRNESELSDQKAAELNNSVWQDLRIRHSLKKKYRQLTQDFIDIGEAIVKLFFDPNAGSFLGYEPVTDASGAPVFKENGDPAVQPVFTGDLVFERILGFNLLRDASAKSWDECRHVIYRKMVACKDLKEQFKDDEERLKFIVEGGKNTYQVFDGQTGSYKSSEGLVMIREFYFRPDAQNPNGYYYITTDAGILHEGELPLGLFPIHYVGFDEIPTCPRSHSIIKQLRPYQAEVNRSASKIAEHQITLGDDKVIIQNGGSISPGGTAHGVKAVKVTGSPPQIMPGRSGEQYLGYMQSQISEMYQVANVIEDSQEREGQFDPYATLFRNIREKKKFSLYGEKWQDFQVDLCQASLRLAKAFFPAEMMIPVFGKKEFVNIEEWKKTDDLSYQVIVEPSSEDAETKIGRQLSLNHIIQYVGQNMDQSDIGKVIRSMPYVNKEEMFSDLTIDYDNATNDILALDRGELVPANPSDNHPYFIKRLTHRTKQADFRYLSQQIQQAYQLRIRQHEQYLTQQKQAEMAAEADFVPTGGYLVTVDFYVPDARDPSKMPKRARVPYESLNWLLQRLEQQGTTQEMLRSLPPQAVANMAAMGFGGRQIGPANAPSASPQGIPQQVINASATQQAVG